MMAALFLILSLAIGFCFYGKRKWTIATLIVALILSSAMLWHHATSSLEILW